MKIVKSSVWPVLCLLLLLGSSSAEERPPVKVHIGSRWLTLGLYGMFNSSKSDFWKIAKALYNSNYTGASVFLDNAYTEVEGEEYWPWPYDPQTELFDMTKDDPRYYARLSDMLDAFEFYGLDLELCFQTVYFTQQWTSGMKSRIHPLRQNNSGVTMGNCSNPAACQQEEKKLYDGVTFQPTKFWYIRWEPISEPLNKWEFSCVPEAKEFCEAYTRWIFKVMDMVKEKRDTSANKEWRFGWKRTNEQNAAIGGEANKGTGDRSELEAWFYEQWAERGLTPDGKTFFYFVNRQFPGSTTLQSDSAMRILHRDITGPYGKPYVWNKRNIPGYGLGAIHEIHVDGVKEVLDLIRSSGFDITKTLVSTDGIPKISAKQYTRDNRNIYLKNWPFVDILYEEGIWPNFTPHSPDDFQYNFDHVFPYHAQIVK